MSVCERERDILYIYTRTYVCIHTYMPSLARISSECLWRRFLWPIIGELHKLLSYATQACHGQICLAFSVLGSF